MNEPSDFVDQTGKNQMDVVSYDEGEKTTHAKNRNTFALLMSRATYEGLERLRPDRRPYVITRAATPAFSVTRRCGLATRTARGKRSR